MVVGQPPRRRGKEKAPFESTAPPRRPGKQDLRSRLALQRRSLFSVTNAPKLVLIAALLLLLVAQLCGSWWAGRGAGHNPFERPSSVAFPEQVERLRGWVSERGGLVSSKVGVDQSALQAGFAAAGGDRGLVAAEPIDKGERLLYIPEAAMVSQSMVKGDPLVAEVREVLESRREKCASCSWKDGCMRQCRLLASESTAEAIVQIELAVWIAKELQNSSSAWQPWLDMLPSRFASFPLALPEPVLKVAFPGTELLSEVVEHQASWRTLHEALTNSSVRYRAHVGSYEVLRSARLTVLSRVHGLKHAGSYGGDAVVPFADLLNHDPEAPTWWGPSKEGGFELRATAPIPAGAAITCSYGAERSSKEFLIHYGFAPETVPGHSVTLQLSVERREELAGAKREALMGMDLYRTFRFGASEGFATSAAPLRPCGWMNMPEKERDAVVFGELLTFLRVLALRESDVKQHAGLEAALLRQDEAALERLREGGGVLDSGLEERAAARLEAACDAYLAELGGAGSQADAVSALRQAATESGEAQALDVPHLAAGAASYFSVERRLYTRLRDLASSVQGGLRAGSWPPKDGAGTGYEALWAGNFASGLRVAAGSPTEPGPA